MKRFLRTCRTVAMIAGLTILAGMAWLLVLAPEMLGALATPLAAQKKIDHQTIDRLQSQIYRLPPFRSRSKNVLSTQ